MNLTEHFSLEELTMSQEAVRFGIDNTPAPEIIENLQLLAEGLERIRVVLGVPILVTSGYRCPSLNTSVGGSRKSAHMRGLAADIYAPQFGTPLEVCRVIAKANLGLDQIIHEFGRWCHVAFPEKDKHGRGELLTIVSAAKGYEIGLV